MSAIFNTTFFNVFMMGCAVLSLVPIFSMLFTDKGLERLPGQVKITIVISDIICVAWLIYQGVVYFNEFLDSLPAFL